MNHCLFTPIAAPVRTALHLIISICVFGLSQTVLAQGWGRPTHSSRIALSLGDKLLWVVNPSDDSVSALRTDSYQVLAKIPVGREPRGVALTPDNQFVYVANALGNSVTVIKIGNATWAGFQADVYFSAGVLGHIATGAEPWDVVCSPDGKRVFVANSAQDTITVIDTATTSVIGHVDLRNSLANDPDRARHFQPRALAVTADNSKLYVTRFFSFTKAGGRQGDDLGREGLVAVLDINTSSTSIADYKVARTVPLAPQITGFRFPGLTNDTAAFPNQIQSLVIRGDHAYMPNIAASPSGPLRFNLDTHAFVNLIGGVNGSTPTDLGALNLHLGARDPEPGKDKIFFANPWAIAFTTQSGAGTAYLVTAASDVVVKVNVGEDGQLGFTVDGDTTRYIDLNDPDNPATSGANAGKNPQGIAITADGSRAYVANILSRNVSVVDLTNDTVIAVTKTVDLPPPGSAAETRLVGAEVFFSSRGNFDPIPGGTNSFRDRLSSEGWQACSSCHFRGLTDSVIWQFAAGPRKSVPLNSTFNPRDRDQQRLLNYSAIFDEVEDFEINIRNVSGPGNLPNTTPPQLDPNHGLLIGDDGDPNVVPSAVNAFAKPNADRPQMTITLPGSTNKVPALTAMREWVRFAVRTPNAPLPGYGGTAADPADLAAGRQLFFQVGCASCHGGGNWSISIKDFISPPAATELFTERNPTNTLGNPVGAQYLDRFLREIGSFNLGVPDQGNLFGNNIGADEKAAPAVANSALQPAQDALGRDYNGDGKGIGFNVPSLLGVFGSPPFLHHGAAESIAAVLEDSRHWTGNGTFPNLLTNDNQRAQIVKFVESIDAQTLPFGLPGDEVVIANFTKGTNNVSLEWFGGAGPYALQKKQNIAEAYFSTVAITAQPPASDTFSGKSAFYRVFDLAQAPEVNFTVSLSGSGERPSPVNTSALGLGSLRLNGNALSFNISYQGLSGPATAAHIHGPAPASEAADVLISLEPFALGGFKTAGSLVGTVQLTPEQKAAVLGHKTYVNIHTAANPGGEIRGQIAATVLKVGLTGEAERLDPVSTSGSGFGLLTLIGKELSFRITYLGLSGTATFAHIHGPAPDSVPVGIMIDLAPHNGGAFGVSGSFAGSVTLTDEQLAALVDGLTYVNIHTAANPGGEIRGQISPHITAIALSADLSGTAERPTQVDTTGAGFAGLSLTGDSLKILMTYRNLSGPATAAHIHGPAPASGVAGVLISLVPLHQGPLAASGVFSGEIELTPEQRQALLAGQTYINVHTQSHPDGEIRGQVSPIILRASLSGQAERPIPLNTDATGAATLSLLGRDLSFAIRYNGLSGPASAAHVHGPGSAETAAIIMFTLQPFAVGGFGPSGIITGSQPLAPEQLAAMVDGLTYVNIHTEANSGGEIRGQIGPSTAATTSPTDPAAVVDAYTAAINGGDVEKALSLVADDAVYDRPPPNGQLVGKEAIRGFIEGLVARRARIELVGERRVEGERVTWTSRVTLLDAQNPNNPPTTIINNSESIVRNGKIVSHTARAAP